MADLVCTTVYLKATSNEDLHSAQVTRFAKPIALTTGGNFAKDKKGRYMFQPYILDQAIEAYRLDREKRDAGLTIY